MLILSCIAIVFALSWLPMTAFTLLVQFHPGLVTSASTMYLTFAICHMTAMSTAVTNPLLYGWLNTNFRREFRGLGGGGGGGGQGGGGQGDKARQGRKNGTTGALVRPDRRISMTCFTTMTSSSHTRPSTTLTMLTHGNADVV
jgi:uncharacterized membrane protein YgcG